MGILDDDDERFVAYDNFDGDNPTSFTSLQLSREDYEAMGEPDDITVTVEPGDRLNEQE